jgi:P2-related tail formation protein
MADVCSSHLSLQKVLSLDMPPQHTHTHIEIMLKGGELVKVNSLI